LKRERYGIRDQRDCEKRDKGRVDSDAALDTCVGRPCLKCSADQQSLFAIASPKGFRLQSLRMVPSRAEAEKQVRSWGFSHVFTWTDHPNAH